SGRAAPPACRAAHPQAGRWGASRRAARSRCCPERARRGPRMLRAWLGLWRVVTGAAMLPEPYTAGMSGLWLQSDPMLWLKALHVVFVVTWFAGLFYLPRLFVYHVATADREGLARFAVMER